MYVVFFFYIFFFGNTLQSNNITFGSCEVIFHSSFRHDITEILLKVALNTLKTINDCPLICNSRLSSILTNRRTSLGVYLVLIP